MCKFKVGDKVTIIKGCSYEHGTFNNPSHGVVGVVTEVVDKTTRRLNIRVSWPNGKNSYKESDLEFAEDAAKRRPHYNLIIAWANGAEIQAFTTGGDWMTIAAPAFQEGVKYRIKPQEPTEVELALAKVKEAEESLNKAKEYLDKVKGG